jgi:NADH:ubiquinone oxidoreductase subunit H
MSKLVEGGFVKKQEREGHKWVFYELTWKGQCLLHPENSKIVILFSCTIASFTFGIFAMIAFMREYIFSPLARTSQYGGPVGQPSSFGFSPGIGWVVLTIVGFVFFVVLLSVSFWRYKKNRSIKI